MWESFRSGLSWCWWGLSFNSVFRNPIIALIRVGKTQTEQTKPIDLFDNVVNVLNSNDENAMHASNLCGKCARRFYVEM